MPRYIDADAIEYHEVFEGDEFVRVAYGDDIDELPTADVVEVKHGRWIDYKCSVCGFEPYNPSGLDTFNFCSNCGADMRGGNNDIH